MPAGFFSRRGGSIMTPRNVSPSFSLNLRMCLSRERGSAGAGVPQVRVWGWEIFLVFHRKQSSHGVLVRGARRSQEAGGDETLRCGTRAEHRGSRRPRSLAWPRKPRSGLRLPGCPSINKLGWCRPRPSAATCCGSSYKRSKPAPYNLRFACSCSAPGRLCFTPSAALRSLPEPSPQALGLLLWRTGPQFGFPEAIGTLGRGVQGKERQGDRDNRDTERESGGGWSRGC